mmetsp:Transcript_132047/g.282435  ORF Transcript_132047/g.282435 Transcript_132047/m.282435 type:complete len:133 (+) Transcript_132047:890-1288(+)
MTSDQARDAEVQQLGMDRSVGCCYKDVSRLKVSMHEGGPEIVQIIERTAHTKKNLETGVRSRPFRTLSHEDEGIELHALSQLKQERNVSILWVHTSTHESNDVGMGNLTKNPEFVGQLCEIASICKGFIARV